jgi:hypothetical protein
MPQRNRHAARNGTRQREKTTAPPSGRAAADRLYRTATECVRHRERYARLVDSGADEIEQRDALRVACLCDEIMLASIRAYEKATGAETAKAEDDLWHKANALWHASREYQRRHHNCDESSRQLSSRKPGKLKELALEFDLEASALLALRLALASYRKVCPECELEERPQSYVA